MSDAPHRVWTFDRYINGVLMAEGVEISRASSFEEASAIAAKLASRGPNGESPTLVFRAPTALAASPEGAALIREAEARGRDAEKARFADLLGAAHGLSYGEDWNNGTHAKTHEYRRKLLIAVGELMGDMASPQAAAIRAAKGEPE